MYIHIIYTVDDSFLVKVMTFVNVDCCSIINIEKSLQKQCLHYLVCVSCYIIVLTTSLVCFLPIFSLVVAPTTQPRVSCECDKHLHSKLTNVA